VQVGLVNGSCFGQRQCGLYPQLLEDREAWKQRLGGWWRFLGRGDAVQRMAATATANESQLHPPVPVTASCARCSRWQ
jgi:hypothetical protein